MREWKPRRTGNAVLDASLGDLEAYLRELATADSSSGVSGSAGEVAHGGDASGLSAWYLANCNNAAALTTGAPTANVLRAMPFIAPARSSYLDRIAVNVTTAVAGNCRLGLYQARSASDFYPTSLLVGSGDLSTGAIAVVSATVRQTLTPGALYWLALVSSAAPTIRCLNLANVSCVLGVTSAFGAAPNIGLSVAFAYAALPSTFPAAAAFFTGTPVPAIAYRVT